MRAVNILFLSVGRRVELLKAFRHAATELAIDSHLIAADISETAPALYFADRYYNVPKVGDDGYIETIIDICQKENIMLIVPTIDTELLQLAENKDRIEEVTNAKVLVSHLDVIQICRDKINTQRFFEEHGFSVPKLVSNEDIEKGNYTFPLFIKPLDGSSSVNTFKVENDQQLQFFLQYIQKPMVQTFIEGDEYTVDAFLDFASHIVSIVPRKRLTTRSGEISKGLIENEPSIIEEVRKLLTTLKPIGHITIQCMKTKDGIQFIEINPRFGGGAPMSIQAGANTPKYLYELLVGKEVSYTHFDDGLLCLRYDEAVFVHKTGEVVR